MEEDRLKKALEVGLEGKSQGVGLDLQPLDISLAPVDSPVMRYEGGDIYEFCQDIANHHKELRENYPEWAGWLAVKVEAPDPVVEVVASYMPEKFPRVKVVFDGGVALRRYKSERVKKWKK